MRSHVTRQRKLTPEVKPLRAEIYIEQKGVLNTAESCGHTVHSLSVGLVTLCSTSMYTDGNRVAVALRELVSKEHEAASTENRP